MEEIIRRLNDIQNDLAGIIIPVLITSIVSIISVIATIISKITSENKTINIEQFKTMQKTYYTLRSKMYELKINISKCSKNSLYKDFDSAIIKYANIISDESKYRNEHSSEIKYIADFKDSTKSIIEKIIDINDYLSSEELPYITFYHPILKHKRKKVIGIFHFYSLYLNKYIKQELKAESIKVTLEGEHKEKLTEDVVEDCIDFIDKWYFIY